MGMFDWYKPAAKLGCPACGHALTNWQGKEGPCGLFVWVEGRTSPEGQRVDDDYALSSKERDRLRLPERFVIYSHDCARHVVEALCKCEEGTWVESRVQWPMPEETTETVQLEFPGGSLRLSAGNWCYVVLENRGRLHLLGAEVRKSVVDSLLRGLVAPLEGAGNGQIDGHTVHWFLSLSEEHASFYIAQHPRGRTVFVQNVRGELVGRLDLTEQLAQEWVGALALER